MTPTPSELNIEFAHSGAPYRITIAIRDTVRFNKVLKGTSWLTSNDGEWAAAALIAAVTEKKPGNWSLDRLFNRKSLSVKGLISEIKVERMSCGGYKKHNFPVSDGAHLYKFYETGACREMTYAEEGELNNRVVVKGTSSILKKAYTAYHENGLKKEEAGYENGLEEGWRQSWNEKDVLQTRAYFIKGVPHDLDKEPGFQDYRVSPPVGAMVGGDKREDLDAAQFAVVMDKVKLRDTLVRNKDISVTFA